MSKISALTELTTPASTDELEVVDKSDTSQAATGTNKRMTWLTTITKIFASRFAADAGSTDAYVVTLDPAPAAYAIGEHYRFKANTANTGTCTVDFNGLGAKTIKKAAGGITTDLADNDIRAGQWVDLVYDGTNMQMQSTLGNAAAGGGSIAPLEIVDANTVRQINGATAQELRVHQDASIFLFIKTVSGAFEVGSTGSNTKIVAGSTKYEFNGAALLTNTADIGSTANRVGTVFANAFNCVAGGMFRFNASSIFEDVANGWATFRPNSGSTAQISFGAATSAGAMLKRNGTRLESRLGDDSAYTQFTCEKLGVNNSAAATTPGSVTKKIEVFDAAGNSLGFIAVYDSIT